MVDRIYLRYVLVDCVYDLCVYTLCVGEEIGDVLHGLGEDRGWTPLIQLICLSDNVMIQLICLSLEVLIQLVCLSVEMWIQLVCLSVKMFIQLVCLSIVKWETFNMSHCLMKIVGQVLSRCCKWEIG